MKSISGVRSILFGIIASATLAVQAASAFPTWIGVYGSTVRHDGKNPGTYTVLMNQDYMGLNAEVGVQVNGGAWATFPMSYSGNVQGNSKWTFTPASQYPSGATVQYYFHGFEGGNHIYDSKNGQNYSFTAQGSSDGLTFSGPQNLGLNSAGGTFSDSYVRGTKAYVLAGGGIQIGTVNATGAVWNSAWTTVPSGATALAANDGVVVTVRQDGDKLVVNRSVNGGQSFGTAFTVSPGKGPILGVDIASKGASDFAIAFISTPATNGYPYDARLLHVVKSTDNGATWGAPVAVDTQEPIGWMDTIEMDANAGSYFIKYRFTQQVYSSRIRVARSADGATWTMDELWGDKVASFSTLCVGPAGAYVALDPYYDNVTRFARFLGTAWEKFTIPHAGYESGRGIKLGLDPQGNLLFLRINAYPANDHAIAKSTDAGATWYNLGVLAAPTAVPSNPPMLQQIRTSGGRTHIVWASTDWRYGSTIWQVSLPRTGGPVNWIGASYHWPLNGDIDATDDLWVNTETYPKGNAASVRLVYTTNGVNWVARDLELETSVGNNDKWHVNLGKFTGGTIVRYAIVATGGDGQSKWDNNGGQDFRARVNPAAGMHAPAFSALNPQNAPNGAKVTANGRTPDANNSFGSFTASSTISVAARPTEFGDGTSVQFGVSFTAWIVYTTTPGNWGNAQIVYGSFFPGAFSNKPIFDYTLFNLGSLPAGSSVEFWMAAENSVGTGYAQSANNNFKFTVN